MPRHRSCLLASAALLLLGGSCKKGESPPQLPRYVRTITLATGDAQGERRFSGITEAGTVSNLSFKVPGLVKERPVDIGAKVNKGDLIARLDDTDYRLKLKQAQADLARARAQARNAEMNYQRMRRLYENRSVSLQDLDSARAEAETTKAQESAQSQAVSLARTQLEDCELKAPADGEIAQLPVDINENVDTGRTVAVLNSGDLPKVKFDVPESMILNVKQGAQATVTFPALPDETLTATVTEVGVAAGATAYPVTVTLNNPTENVRAGMAAEVHLSVKVTEGVEKKLFVPAHTVMEDATGRFVYVAETTTGEEANVARRPVKTGELTSIGIEISEGLKPGDHVIVAGLRAIQPKTRVRVVTNKQ